MGHHNSPDKADRSISLNQAEGRQFMHPLSGNLALGSFTTARPTIPFPRLARRNVGDDSTFLGWSSRLIPGSIRVQWNLGCFLNLAGNTAVVAWLTNQDPVEFLTIHLYFPPQYLLPITTIKPIFQNMFQADHCPLLSIQCSPCLSSTDRLWGHRQPNGGYP